MQDGAGRWRLLPVLLAPLLGALALPAQAPLVTGRIVHGGRGDRPLPRVWAVLHRVARDSSGPIDSALTDARGRYHLRLPAGDTLALFLVSATHDGIGYFSAPVRNGGGVPAPQTLVVYDTGSTGPPMRLARRVVTVARPGRDGTREVLEIVQLENPGRTTRVAPDTIRPTWAGALPEAAIQFRVGEGDVSPEAVARRGDAVAVFAPLAPGSAKQVSYAYVLPADVRQLALPVDQWTGEVNLLLEDTAAVVSAPRLDTVGVQEIERRRFAAYRTDSLAAGARVLVALSAGSFRAQQLIPYIVGIVAAVLVVGFVVALRRAPRPS
ncbi:MAG: hypothetical protein ACREL9_12135 [Gemmatimonadales bacterium]